MFLDNACKRYNLPSIDYDFVDVQTIHKDYNNLINPFSTEKLVEELNLDVNKYVPHKSDDDAEVSMLVTKNFAKSWGCRLINLSRSIRIVWAFIRHITRFIFTKRAQKALFVQ